MIIPQQDVSYYTIDSDIEDLCSWKTGGPVVSHTSVETTVSLCGLSNHDGTGARILWSIIWVAVSVVLWR